MNVFLLLTACSWIGGESHDSDLAVWSLAFEEPSIGCGSSTLSIEATTDRPDGDEIELSVDVGGTQRSVRATSGAGRFVWTVSDVTLDPTTTELVVFVEGVQASREEILPIRWSGFGTYHLDEDGDGFGAGASVDACEAPERHVANDEDCDDGDPAVRPGVPELCGGGDDDCNGLVDDDPIDLIDGYVDLDGDGAAGTPATACDAVLEATDCDDADADIGPDAVETCSGIDDDCDGLIDDADPSLMAPGGLVDADGDGHAALLQIPTCHPVTGLPADDCDDQDADVNPDEAEVCDQVDNDCDGLIDDDDDDRATGPNDAWYPDHDMDGLGLDEVAQRVVACVGPIGFVNNDQDCDDGDHTIGGPTAYYRDLDGDHFFAINETYLCDPPSVDFQLTPGDDCSDIHENRYPGAPELCDGDDDDCDGGVDTPAAPIMLDSDDDGFGGDVPGPTTCPASLDGYSQSLGDCDDGDPHIRPDALELCDGVDNNCDTAIDIGAPAGFLPAAPSLALPDWDAVLADAADAYSVCGHPDWSGVLDRSITLTLREDAEITGRLEVSGATLAVVGGRLIADTSGTHGGALSLDGSTANLSDVTIACSSGGTVGNGGAIAGVDSIVQLNGATIDGCHADQGGAIWGDETSVTLIDTTLSSNSATDGGAVYMTGNQGLTLGGLTTLLANEAVHAGGAAGLFGFNTSLTVQSGADVRFEGNDAALGGAIYTHNTLALGAATYVGNTAEQGGALYPRLGAPVIQGHFEDNIASVAGGAVYVPDNATLATPVTATFTANRVGESCALGDEVLCTGPGGAIYAQAPLAVQEGARFESNGAFEGGAIALDQALLSVSVGSAGVPVLFDGNSASAGNAISSTGGGVELDGIELLTTGAAQAYVLLQDGTLTCAAGDTGGDAAVEFVHFAPSGPFSPSQSYTCVASTGVCSSP